MKELMEKISSENACVGVIIGLSYVDLPLASSIKTKVGKLYFKSTIGETLKGYDCEIFVINHNYFRDFNIRELFKIMNSPAIIDCKNLNYKSNGVIYSGVGKNNGN